MFSEAVNVKLKDNRIIFKIITGLLLLQVAFYLYGLYNRMPDIDDAWIGEHAYWMAESGFAKSELMHGWQNQEDRILIHHKLMTLVGYVAISLFGFSLYALKSISLFTFLLFLGVFYYYTRIKKIILTKEQFLIALLIIFIFHYTFKFSFIFRPEIIIMLLTFLSFVMLDKAISNNSKENKNNLISLIIAGLLSGLCGVAHLNGLAVLFAGAMLLIINKKLKFVFPFILGGLISFSIYFYDFTSKYNFTFWKQQLFQSVLGNNGGVTDVLYYMGNSFLKEHMRFFHDLSIIGFSLLLITCLIGGYKYLIKNHRTLLQYTLILWIIVALLFTQKSRQYILIYLPFLIIIISIVLDLFIKQSPGLKSTFYKLPAKIFMFAVLALFIYGSEMFNLRVSIEKYNPDSNRNLVTKYIKEDPATLKIIAPMEFIFDEIKYFKRIQGERLYTTLQQYDTTITGDGFFKKAASFDAEYILLTNVYYYNLGADKGNPEISGYKQIGKEDQITIFKRNKMMQTIQE